jgi:predicted  nucleic acid-binding Zn-ribbon protein
MTDEISNLILEHLKAVRADQQIMKNDLRDIKARLLSMEIYQAAIHTDSSHTRTRLDELEQRLERIEKRLDEA